MMRSGDERQYSGCPSIVRAIEYDLAIVIRRRIALVRRRGHVESATGSIHEAAYCEKSVLRSTGNEFDRRHATENAGFMRPPDPFDTFIVVGEENSKPVVNAEDR